MQKEVIGNDHVIHTEKVSTDGKSYVNTNQQSTAQTEKEGTSTDTNVHSKK